LWLFFSIFGWIAHAPHQIIHKAGPGRQLTFRTGKDNKNGGAMSHFVGRTDHIWHRLMCSWVVHFNSPVVLQNVY